MEEKTYKNYLDKGIFDIQDGFYKSAVESLNKSIELKNDFEVSYFYRAVAYHALEDYTQAMLDYTKALKINPKMTDAYYNRAKIILEKENSTQVELEKAVNDLEEALKLDDKFIDALFAMAAAQKKLKNYHKALEYLERILAIDEKAVHARALKKLILTKYVNELK